jgi:archaellum component FlaC
MGFIYNGKQLFNDTIRLQGPAPLDERFVLNSLSDLEIVPGRKEAPLYSRAYKGMIVSIFDSVNPELNCILQLIDNYPYLPENTEFSVFTEGNNVNYLKYWHKIDDFSGIYETIDERFSIVSSSVGIINSSIPKIYVSIENLEKTDRIISSSIDRIDSDIETLSMYSTGFHTDFVNYVNTIDSSINNIRTVLEGERNIVREGTGLGSVLINDVNDNKASGINSIASGTNTNAIGNNSHTEGSETTASADDAHAEGYKTKALASDSHAEGYNTIASGLDSHAEGYQTAASGIYSHTEGLYTQAKNKSEHASGQYNISHSENVDGWKIHGNTLFSVGNGTSDSDRKNAFEIRQDGSIYIEGISDTIQNYIINTSVNLDVLNKQVQNVATTLLPVIQKASYFDGGTTDNNVTMITKHGNIEKKSIGDLEKMTISEILKNILFETAVPVKINGISAMISWNTNTFRNTVDVNHAMPTESDFSYSFISEQWNWTASDGTTKGTPKQLSQETAHVYMKSPSSYSTDNSITSWSSQKSSAGYNGYFYVSITYTGKDNATDSAGSTTDSAGNIYQAPKSGTIISNMIYFYSASRVYTNASKCQITSLYDVMNTNPGTFKGNDNQTVSDFFVVSSTDKNASQNRYDEFYAQWPDGTTSTQYFYIYVPVGLSIYSVLAADPQKQDQWTINISVAKENGTVVKIVNPSGAECDFYKWKLSEKAAGITTVKIKLTNS